MKKWAISLLALLLAAPVHAEEKTFGGFSGSTTVPAPTISGQILGTDGLTAMWMTLAGGNGNCYLQYNGPGSYSLICPNFGSGGGGGGQVPGGPPQFIGYSSTDINEAVTSVGDVTYQRTAPNTYTATVNSVGGIPGPFLTANNPAFTGILTGPTINITGNGSTLGTTNISSLTVSGTLNGASVVLQGILNFGSAGALYFNGIPIGGTCGPDQFVNSINAKGVPTCAEPSGGGGPWLPVDNPTFTGTLSGPAMNLTGPGGNWLFEYNGASTAQINWPPNGSNFVTQVSPSTYFIAYGGVSNPFTIWINPLPQRVEIGTGYLLRVAGAATEPGSPLPGSFYYNTTSNLMEYWNGTEWVTISGGGPWLPVNNPSFTGALNGPGFAADASGIFGANLSIGSGTATIGLNGNISTDTTIGSGNALVVNVRGLPMLSVNAATGVVQLGTITGTSSSAIAFQIDANGNVLLNRNATLPLGATTLQQVQALVAASGPWLPVNNPTFTGTLTGPTANLSSVGLFLPASSGTGPVLNNIYFGLAVPYSGTMSVGPGNFVTASQAHTNGPFWVADAATAVLENLSSLSGGIAFYSDTGLTVGETYTPTVIADISPTVGLNIPNMTTGDGGVVIRGNVNSNIGIITQNVNTNAAANSSIFLQSSDHTLQLAQLSSNWTANPFFGIDSSIIMTDALNLYVGSYSAASTLNFNLGGALFGRFVNQNPIIQGLELPGFAGPLPNFMSSSLHIGNAYMGAYGWAGLDITGASYFDNNVGYWRSDGGAGSGAALLSLNTGCITMYNTAPVSSGAAINWLQMAIWCGSGEEVGHLSNMKSERIPTVSSGVLVADSRDSFGWVTKVMGGQTTITFAEPFISQSNCSLTASGTPYTWFNADQDTKHSTFVCVVPWTGEQCPDDITVEYHCFGQTGKDGPQLIGKR